MTAFFRRVAALAALVALSTAACSSGGAGGGDSATTKGGGARKGEPAAAFTVAGTDVQSMATPAPAFSADVAAGVKATLDGWLAAGVIGPLRTGKPPTGLEPLFTGAALASLGAAGQQRASMLEEGAPLTGTVTQQKAEARLTALAAPEGAVTLVTAQVDLAQAVAADDGTVDVVRTGELVLVPEGGTWRIDAFDMVAKHDSRPR